MTVRVDHVGSFGGVTRVFSDVTINTEWRLTRVGAGPWRVAEVGLI